MNEGQPLETQSGDLTNSPIVGGTLLDALDSALEAAWTDDLWIEALAHDEGLIEVVANLDSLVKTSADWGMVASHGVDFCDGDGTRSYRSRMDDDACFDARIAKRASVR